MLRFVCFVLIVSTTPSSAFVWSWERHHHHRAHHHHGRHHRAADPAPEPDRNQPDTQPETVDCVRVRAAVAQLNSAGATDWCAADIGIPRCSPSLNRQLKESDRRQIAIISGCMREGK